MAAVYSLGRNRRLIFPRVSLLLVALLMLSERVIYP
jgi:hypothetical protein